MNYYTKIVFIILLLSFFTSCNSVKRLSDNQYLLTKNNVVVNNKKTNDLEVLSFIHQRPNQKVLGLPFALYVHNWANQNFETTQQEWSINHPNKTKVIKTVFSKKQVGEVFLFNKKINNILKNSGEPPVIFDENRTKKSIKTLKRFYFNKGYFDVDVNFEAITDGIKRKRIQYSITTNKAYLINNFLVDIESPVLKKIYLENKDESFIKEGVQYDRDNLIKEQNRLTNIFRNSGIFFFSKNFISFKGVIKDSAIFKRDIKLIIKEKNVSADNSDIPNYFKIKKVTKINIITDFSFTRKGEVFNDSLHYKGLSFFAFDKIKFKPKKLVSAIAITPNGVYKDTERRRTIQYLNDLAVFRSPINIEYVSDNKGHLTANINLIPLKKFGLDIHGEVTHSNIKPFGVLGKLGFVNRNTFRGSEIFEFSIQGSFLNVAEDTADPDFSFFGLTAWEIGANTSFKIPRIFLPFKTSSLITKQMRPSTNIGVSTSFQKNIGLDRQNITGNIAYNWRNGKKIKHQFELLNVQYINNVNSSNYFKVFNSEFTKLSNVAQEIPHAPSMNSEGEIIYIESYINHILNPVNNFAFIDFENFKIVQRVRERKNIITEDLLVPAMTYSFTYNGKRSLSDNDFSFFSGRVVSSGSITSTLTQESEYGKKELLGLPIAQYIKTEFEYKKYWNFYNNNHLVFRTFIGAAIPFGNSTEIPFSRSYRAGGSNDIRAWRTFDLGPGASQSNLDFNIGNFKFVSNLEYRFNIINSFYSALFIDAGNVWDITQSNLTSNDAKFKGFGSIKEIAIGSGFGFRYDFGFLTFRTDFGFKTYEPYLLHNKRWFNNYNFSNTVFNFGINYPF